MSTCNQPGIGDMQSGVTNAYSGLAVTTAASNSGRPVARAPRAKLKCDDRIQSAATRFRAVPRIDALTSEPKIMIVDDEMTTIDVIQEQLRIAGYNSVLTCNDETNALARISGELPDILLLDVNMPLISGLEILKTMQNSVRLCDVSVLIMSASADHELKIKALQYGASDYISKPIHQGELLARLKNCVLARAFQLHMQDYSRRLEAEVRQRTAELEISRREVINCLARAAEFRDDDTGQHVARVGRYARLIASEFDYSENQLDTLEQAAKLHDIGKIGIPDAILLKPGKLTSEEFEFMQRHCNFGKRIVTKLTDSDADIMRRHAEVGAKILDVGRSPLLDLAMSIALTHHEKWDGTGYPLGLAGEDIPLAGRITSVADVFDALSSKRVYKPAFSMKKCLEILEQGRGTQFDPAVIDAFFARKSEIVEVQIRFADSG